MLEKIAIRPVAASSAGQALPAPERQPGTSCLERVDSPLTAGRVRHRFRLRRLGTPRAPAIPPGRLRVANAAATKTDFTMETPGYIALSKQMVLRQQMVVSMASVTFVGKPAI